MVSKYAPVPFGYTDRWCINAGVLSHNLHYNSIKVAEQNGGGLEILLRLFWTMEY